MMRKQRFKLATSRFEHEQLRRKGQETGLQVTPGSAEVEIFCNRFYSTIVSK